MTSLGRLACALFFLFLPAGTIAGEQSAIKVIETSDGARVRYTSGGVVYVEELRLSRWVARHWSAAQAAETGEKEWDLDAFQLRVRLHPNADETEVDGHWIWEGAAEVDPNQLDRRHIVVRLTHRVYPVNVTLHTVLDGTPVLKRWLGITNRSEAPIALTGVFPWSGKIWESASVVSLGYTTRTGWPWEGWFEWKLLKAGTNLISQEIGLAHHHPFFMLRNKGSSEYFFGSLAWPVNRVMEFEKDGGVSFRIGPTATSALRVIAPGETIETPAVHVGFVRGEFDEAVQAMHEHVRRSVVPPRRADRAFRIQCLMPEDQPLTVYRGKEFNEANIRKLMDVASALGIELFILDGPNWCPVYGNWLDTQPEQFPNGLQPLVDYAHSKGMLFGLYAEPEGGRNGYTSAEGGLTIRPWEDSKVFQEHPDWFFSGHASNDRRFPVLNLAVPGAAAYLEETIGGIISHHRLDLYRHDFNGTHLGQGSETLRDGFRESDYWRHYEALYPLLERIRNEYPDVILQQASYGGARMDLGTVARFDEHFTTDRASAPYVYRTLSGMTVYLPPEILATSIGLAEVKYNIDFITALRSIFALGGTPMVFNVLLPRSVDELKPDVKAKFLRYAEMYKTFMRPMLPEAKIYHHAPVNASGGVESGDWFAMEFASPDRTKAWAMIVRLSSEAGKSYSFHPKGLDPARPYTITFDNTGQTTTLDGSSLVRKGLTVRVPEDPNSELLLIKAR